MKPRYYTFYKAILILLYTLHLNNIYAEEIESCQGKTDYQLYTCQTSNICTQYTPEITIVKDLETYLEVDEYIGDPDFGIFYANFSEMYPFEMAKKNYRDNISKIYKCGLIKVQKRGLEDLSKIINNTESAIIKNRIQKRIEQRLKKLNTISESLSCIENTLGNQRKYILDNTTEELCYYQYYLIYLADYYKNNIAKIANNLENNSPEKKENTFSQIGNELNSILFQIKTEIDHSYQIFPIAYTSFSEYYSNYYTHILLELIKEDFLVLREYLHKTLNPINQVVYKIANAMGW